MSNKIRASLIELFKRFTPLDNKDNIYHNGGNNLYPNEIERVVNNSPTAKRAFRMMVAFIGGMGISGENKIVNEKKGYRITDLIKLVSEDLVRNGGAFIHMNYGIVNGVVVPVSYDVLDYAMCRIMKPDDDGNEGKILYKDYEKKQKLGGKKEDPVTFFPFTSNQDVLLAQIKKSGGDSLEDSVKRFKGNVYFMNPSNYHYPLSYFDAVYNDCDTEYRISLYVNTMSRLSFLGKTLIVTQGLDVEESKQIKEDIAGWLGAENAQGVYHMDVEMAEDLDKVIKIQQIDSQFNDEMFDKTKTMLVRNILGAANNIPESLAYASEGALFGSSGEAYAQMKQFYSEQTDYERTLIETTFLSIGLPLTITPIT